MTSVLDWLDYASEHQGIHFAEPGGGWTFVSYATLGHDSARVAGLLKGRGARPGEIVSLLVSEPKEFVPAFLGTMLAGLTPSPIAAPVTLQGNDRYVEHVADILRVARPSVVLSDATLLDIAVKTANITEGTTAVLLEEISSLPIEGSYRCPPADLQLLQFTSGSSGTPKGVRVSRENLAANVSSIHQWLGITEADSCSSWLPMYHDMGLIGTFLGSVVAQIDLWLMSPIDFLRSPLRWLEVHGRHGATVTTSPNFGYAYAAKRVRPEQLQDLDFSSWRVAMNGAERIDPGAAAAFTELLAPHGFRSTAFTPCYGMAEATLAVCGVPPGSGARTVRLAGGLRTGEPVIAVGEGRLGIADPDDDGKSLTSCGPPVAGTRVDVVDEDGNPLPAGCFGEIRVQGDSVAHGYLAATSSASSNFTDSGLRTGDSGFLLDGELFVVGRIGDSLKVRGRKVHAEDLEIQLAAVGIGGGRCAVALGASQNAQHVVVLVESGESAWLDGALSVIRAATDDAVQVTVSRATRGAIPRTSSGKPRRRLIWQQFLAGEVIGELVHGRSPVPAV